MEGEGVKRGGGELQVTGYTRFHVSTGFRSRSFSVYRLGVGLQNTRRL